MAQMKVLARGAEATIYLVQDPILGVEVVKKVRHPKAYRHPELDERIRRTRTKHEAKLLHLAKVAGLRVPYLYEIDLDECAITMEYIKGRRLRDVIDPDLAYRLGRYIGMLHKAGIVHGDLTTSNMLLADDIAFIDFSLGDVTEEMEPRGVDLRVLAENVKAIHIHLDFAHVLRGYKEVHDIPIEEQIGKIEQRGRYLRRGG